MAVEAIRYTVGSESFCSHSFTDVGVNVPPEAPYNEAAARQTYAAAHAFIAAAFAGAL